MLKFKCPCGRTLTVDEKHAGKKARCPSCQRVFAVPALPTAVELPEPGLTDELPPLAGPEAVPPLGWATALAPSSVPPTPPAAPAAPPTPPAAPTSTPHPTPSPALDDLRTLYRDHKAKLAQAEVSCLGCLVGLPLFPLGIYLLARSGSRQARISEQTKVELAHLGRRQRLSLADLCDLAGADPEMMNDKPFLLLVDAQRTAAREQEAKTRQQEEERRLYGGHLPSDGFKCGPCGGDVVVSEVGANVVCPKCGRQLDVPLHPPCPKCGGHSEFQQAAQGSKAASFLGGLIGQAVLGDIGGAIGGAAGGNSQAAGFRCAACQNLWQVVLHDAATGSPLAGPAPAGAPAPPQAGPTDLAALLAQLVPHQPTKNWYLAGSIPDKKLRNAIAAYAPHVPPYAVLALADGTVFGSAKDGCIVAPDALYFNNNGVKGRVAWNEVISAMPASGFPNYMLRFRLRGGTTVDMPCTCFDGIRPGLADFVNRVGLRNPP